MWFEFTKFSDASSKLVQFLAWLLSSDVNKDWTHKDQAKDKDQSHKDKDLTYKDSKQKRRQAQHSFFKTVSLNVSNKHW